ncbi:MAG: type II toxin-antitoxin system prevent-host-death family antitoxin [Ignavibacteria bacterium]|nr:type II toxin-antitoxin system prevent-host-death family antitoxin [Ignavibacteria bacterium]
MTKTVNLSKKKVNLAEILSIVEEGNEVIITKNKKRVAKVIPFTTEKKERILNQFKDKIWTSVDFELPIPQEYWESEN